MSRHDIEAPLMTRWIPTLNRWSTTRWTVLLALAWTGLVVASLAESVSYNERVLETLAAVARESVDPAAAPYRDPHTLGIPLVHREWTVHGVGWGFGLIGLWFASAFRRGRQRERRAAHEALRQNEERFRALAENALVGVYIVHEGRYVYVNPAMAAIFGYTVEEMTGLGPLDIVQPEGHALVEENIRRRIEAEAASQRYEVLGRHKDGSVRHVEVFGTRVVMNGKPALVGTLVDISERKATEEARARADYFFRESQRAASIGSYRADFAAGQWESSEVLDEIFGIGRDFDRSIAGWLSLVHPDDVAMMERHLTEDVLTKRRPFDRDYRIVRRRDGETRWVHGRGAVLLDERGTVVSMTGTIQDITERKHAEEAIRDTEERFRTIFKTNPDACYVATRDEGVILETNDGFERVFGYSHDEAVGRTSFALDMWVDPAARAPIVGQLRTAGSVREAQVRARRKNGEIFSCLISMTQLPLAGQPCIVGIVRDISAQERVAAEKAQLELQFQQSQKLESVGRLAGGVAHDFNNLLTVMRGYLELALEATATDARVHGFLTRVNTAVDSAAGLTAQLLAFSRKQVIQPQVISLNEVVVRVQQMLPRLVGEDVDVHVRLAPALWQARFDRGQLEQILINLSVNARDAMPDGGKLTIETFNVPDVGGASGDCVALAVSDTGTGMSAEVRTHLFEPFFTTKATGRGTGLGLAMVYGAVSQNSGRIEVDSEVGRGSTFTIHLPRVCVEEGHPPALHVPAGLAKGTEVLLVVEDDAELRALSSFILTGRGYVVHAFADSARALQALETLGPIDLLLTDVIMPGMNGRMLAERVVAIRPGTKVLYCSGYTSDVIAQHGVLDDDVAFLPKPYSARVLAERVREVLDRPAP